MNKTKVLFFLFLIGLLSCASKPKLENILNLNYQPYILSNCRIFDADMNTVKMLPGGRFCALNDDGSWISADTDKITKYGPLGEVLWQKKAHYHHQVRLDKKNNILALTSEFKKIYGKMNRFDLIVKYDQQGNELARFSYAENFSQIQSIRQDNKFEFVTFSPVYKQRVKADFEMSHVNSINLAQEGYVVNDYMLRTCFLLDENLNWTGKHYPVPKIGGENLKIGDMTHDCHLLEDESILYYSNQNDFGTEDTYQVIHFKEDEIIFSFPNDPKDFRRSKWAGGVQLIAGHYFMTTTDYGQNTHFVLVNKQGEKRMEKTFNIMFQDARILNLNNFLKNNKL